MTTWPDRRVLDLFGIELPIVQAPMVGVTTREMVIAVSEAGGLGSLACAALSLKQVHAVVDRIRSGTSRPINLNFFCHAPPSRDVRHGMVRLGTEGVVRSDEVTEARLSALSPACASQPIEKCEQSIAGFETSRGHARGFDRGQCLS